MAIDPVCKMTVEEARAQHKTAFQEKTYMKKIAVVVLLLIITLIPSTIGAYSGNSTTPTDNDTYFTRIYIDGANADSSSFKLLLRASERHAQAHFQPYVVNVNFKLLEGDKVIYSDVKRQIPVGENVGGSVEVSHPWQVALEEGKNYTARADIYLFDMGREEYLTTATVDFTAIMDAAITDIYGDSIGASATVKGDSMVPLDARIIFMLKQDGRVLEVRETKAPFIMSNDKEKTVDVLWNKSLQPGAYIISSELRGREVITRYDKAITVEKPRITAPAATPTPAAPGFPVYAALAALLAVIMVRRDKR